MANRTITIIETIPDPASEMAANIGADEWVKAQSEIRQLQGNVQALLADREALAVGYRDAIALIASVARQAATARYNRDADRIKELTTIHLRLDRFLNHRDQDGNRSRRLYAQTCETPGK